MRRATPTAAGDAPDPNKPRAKSGTAGQVKKRCPVALVRKRSSCGFCGIRRANLCSMRISVRPRRRRQRAPLFRSNCEASFRAASGCLGRKPVRWLLVQHGVGCGAACWVGNVVGKRAGKPGVLCSRLTGSCGAGGGQPADMAGRQAAAIAVVPPACGAPSAAQPEKQAEAQLAALHAVQPAGKRCGLAAFRGTGRWLSVLHY